MDMAVTGIVNGYNMYMNPYYTGRTAQAAGTAASSRADSVVYPESASADAIFAGDGSRNTAGDVSRSAAAQFPAGTADGIAAGVSLRAGIPWRAVSEKVLNAAGVPLPSGQEAQGGTSPAEAEDPDAQKKAGRKSSPEECQTCKERKYQDGSDENVSFKSAAHISPEAAGAAVRAHEGEHVSNAYKEAAEKGGEVVSASVMIHTAICPECGRTYVSGGTTNTTIRFSQEENPYKKAKEAQEAIRQRGKNIDYAA